MKYLIIVFILFKSGCNNTPSETSSPVAENINGEALFRANCASCHKTHEDFTGPALSGTFKRWSAKQLVYEFIRNPDSVIRKNNYAKELEDKFGSRMSAFPDLSNE